MLRFFLFEDMLTPFLETIYMTFISTIIAYIFGFFLAILLILTDKDGLKPNKTINKLLNIVIINITRSIPFIILMVLLIPLSRLLVGRSYGSTAFIIPLSLGSAPFIARLIESSFKEIDKGIIEASKSMGASDFQIIFKVMIPESLPSLIRGFTLTIISLIGYSATAGSIGGGGLGSSAIIDGYQRFNLIIMFQSTFLIIVLVQLVQYVGNKIVQKIIDRR